MIMMINQTQKHDGEEKRNKNICNNNSGAGTYTFITIAIDAKGKKPTRYADTENEINIATPKIISASYHLFMRIVLNLKPRADLY